MNIKTKNNNGYQYYQENNYYYGHDQNNYLSTNCIGSVRKVGKISWSVIKAVIGVLADIITIYLAVRDVYIHGFWNAISSYRICVYIIVGGIILILVRWLLQVIYKLFRNKTYGDLVLFGDSIYKIIPNECPVCGKTCGGKLRIISTDNEYYYACHREKSHRWHVNYNDIINYIKENDK